MKILVIVWHWETRSETAGVCHHEKNKQYCGIMHLKSHGNHCTLIINIKSNKQIDIVTA